MKPFEHRPELLCPAGNFEAMRAAVANGADAVYFGLPAFNARHRAENFTLENLPETMRYLHRHNVKGFVTFNVLIFSDELPLAVDYIRAIASAGVDAVIVQDLGLVRLIKAVAPRLEVHSSTQMTLTEPRGVRFAQRLGVERVVLAREMSVAEIAKVTGAVPEMPVEVFVHGALCVAYSGQCLTSESFGGRSANRGQCAQACRMPYDLIVDGAHRPMDEKYLVSPTDLGGWPLVGELARAGVASLKIEGRLKSAHYVASTAQAYRAAIDGVAAPVSEDELSVIYTRGFSPGFLDGVDHQRLVPGRFPKSRGRRVGTFVAPTPRGFVIELDADLDLAFLKNGDGIVFDESHPEEEEAHGSVYKVEPWRDSAHRRIATSARGRLIHVELGNRDARPHDVEPGAIVWKTHDPQLEKRLEQSWSRDRIVHRVPIDITVVAHSGQCPRLIASDGAHTIEVEDGLPLGPAERHPITQEHARRQLDRLLDTPFVLREVTLQTSGAPMLPNSTLASLRRRAVEQLIEARHQAVVAPIADADALTRLRGEVRPQINTDELRSVEFSSIEDRSDPRDSDLGTNPSADPCSVGVNPGSLAAPSVHVLARTIEQVEAIVALPPELRPASVYCDFEDVRRYPLAVERLRPAGIPVVLATMRIIKPGEEGWLQHVLNAQPDAILVRNLAGIGFYSEKAPAMPLIGDFSLNVANELTAQILFEANLVRLAPSYDLSWTQLAAMIRRIGDARRLELVVHQHMPMFHMEHCVFANTLSQGKDYRDCGRPCEKHAVDLRDRLGNPHPLIPDAGCRNTLFNAQAQSALSYLPKMVELGVRHYRLELLREPGSDVGQLLATYRDVLAAREKPRAALRSLSVVSQLGVTAGTLDRE